MDIDSTDKYIECQLSDPATSDQNGPPLVAVEYLAEGAANVVFSLRPSNKAKFNFKHVTLGHVLRISKGLNSSSSSSTVPGIQVKRDFDQIIAPIFHEDGLSALLLDLETVRLPRELIEQANEQIMDTKTSSRKTKLPDSTDVGFLMPDMSSVLGESLTIEIKPKWLLQSPNAPEESYRCRNCALHAQRKATCKKLDINGEPYICPLKLHAGNPSDIQSFIRQRIREDIQSKESIDPDVENRVVDAMTAYFSPEGQGHKILDAIHKRQRQYDPEGIQARPTYTGAAGHAKEILYIAKEGRGDQLFNRPAPHARSAALPVPDTDNLDDELSKAEEDIERLEQFDRGIRIAMTLRDCSLYVRANYTGKTVEIEAKLGDLDYKSDQKFNDWQLKEHLLVQGLYYKGMGKGQLDRDYTEQCLVAEKWRANVPRYW